MTIKQCFGVITLILLSSFFAKGQESSESKFFVKVVGGYAFIAPGSVATINTYPQQNFEESGQKFGQGLRVGLGAGYIFNENINLGIDVIYHKGAKLDFITTHDQKDQYFPTNSTVLYQKIDTGVINTTFNYSILNIVPHITFRAISKPNYHIYNRVGLIIGLPLQFNFRYQEATSIQTKDYWSPSKYNFTDFYNFKHYASYTKNLSIGFQAAVGVQFKLTKNLRFLTEIEASSLVLTPHELVFTSFENITTTVDNNANRTVKTDIDRKPRHVFYDKKGQTRFETKDDVVNIYQSRGRFTTNSLSLNVGLALRL